MAIGNYKPQIVFQGALIADLDGTLHSPLKEGLKPSYNLLYLYPDEMNREAVLKAVKHAKSMRVHNAYYARASLTTADSALGITRYSDKAREALIQKTTLDAVQDFQKTDKLNALPSIEQLRKKAGNAETYGLLIETYPLLKEGYLQYIDPQNDAEKLVTYLARHDQGPSFAAVEDAERDAFYAAFVQPVEPGAKTFREYTVASWDDKDLAHRILCDMIEKRLDDIAKNPRDFLARVKPQLPKFRMGFTKSVVVHLGFPAKNHALHDLPHSRAYSQTERELLADHLEAAIDKLPERTKYFLAKMNLDFYIADSREHLGKADRHKDALGTCYTNRHIIFIKKDQLTSASADKTVFEEVTHAIHGFAAPCVDHELFVKAYDADMALPGAQKYFLDHAYKTHLEASYDKSNAGEFGAEVMVEMAHIERGLMESGMPQEQARAKITEMMPHMGQCYTGYCELEDMAYRDLSHPDGAANFPRPLATSGFARL